MIPIIAAHIFALLLFVFVFYVGRLSKEADQHKKLVAKVWNPMFKHREDPMMKLDQPVVGDFVWGEGDEVVFRTNTNGRFKVFFYKNKKAEQ